MTDQVPALAITGRTAVSIAADLRALIERGVLATGDALPPVRALADEIGVNRNTVVAAYRQLAQAGLVASRGRGGTRVTGVSSVPEEGFAPASDLRDVAAGNPDPSLIPDASAALTGIVGRPVLYGEPVIDAGLEEWAGAWMGPDVPAGFRLTITNGSFDAVERLLAQALARDDAVAVEDPGFLATIRTVRLAGYRPIAVAVDGEGMTPDGLRAALEAGARAVVVTPRAQNPTGATLTERRASELRDVLADHPYALVIADDHFSLLSHAPYRSLVGPGHRRYALVRSVSKFLGPDMSLAIVASDEHTAARLAERLSPGTTWVSHLLQRLAHAQLAGSGGEIAAAGDHYARRNAAFAAALAERGIAAEPGEGLTVWVDVGRPADAVAGALARRGWRARPGDEFRVADRDPSRHLRITAHRLSDAEQGALADALRDAIDAV
ncbi:aminotransferase class I/II-fold pyridoxal phosphate-dependent enzyme [Microbacterium indicum]|uniref:aminotransferase class I/II-fold pyridoxal phosphate-dependent enzyme n=1 Tax=Microbacterium indicum TaxID=358100 RepID=UPI00041A126A|nr:aminotransferase class I/II-fold pyridoxal phosphate-dependent enzyme [Microbacterium indicum]